MEFVEGQHREMELFSEYHNIKFTKYGEMISTNFNEKTLSISESSVIYANINMRSLTSTKQTGISMEYFQLLSGAYHKITSTQVKTSIVDIILDFIRYYTQKKDSYQPICLKSLQMSIQVRGRIRFKKYGKVIGRNG